MTYLQITLKIAEKNRPAAVAVYQKYRAPFLENVAGAASKELLVREDDVQVLHGLGTVEQAKAYLASELFASDIVHALTPLLDAAPEIRVYEAG